MLFQYVVHPRGLDPFQAAKAWHLRVQGGLPWKKVRAQVHTVSGAQPGQDAIEDAVARVGAQRHALSFQKSGAVQSKYHRCGRAPLLTRAQKQAVVAFVKRWRNKRFCMANYIIQELRDRLRCDASQCKARDRGALQSAISRRQGWPTKLLGRPTTRAHWRAAFLWCSNESQVAIP